MGTKLESLTNGNRGRKKKKIVGRGPGSKRGKTCCRGQKGMGARSGYKTRPGAIGGGVPLHKVVPTRGFSNARFQKRFDVINLAEIDALYNDGETVSLETLREKKYLKGKSCGVKVLGNGKLTKKVTFKVEGISEGAKVKIKEAGIAI